MGLRLESDGFHQGNHFDKTSFLISLETKAGSNSTLYLALLLCKSDSLLRSLLKHKWAFWVL